jgi:outer membrane receptor protein involved in Fe transport
VKSLRFIRPWLTGASALAIASTAAAQTVAGAAGEQLAEVVITGSRVITNGNDSPTPVTVVPVEQLLDLKPGPIGEAMGSLPALGGSRISTSNPGTGVTNASANSLNLRQLGYNRGLVLFDNSRVPPTTYDQLVDLNLIPQMLLQRVDIVTGGVSAVYGSDAISGVVNFITDAKFNGVKADVGGGVSTYGDNRTWNVGIAAGSNVLGGRGHVEISYQHRDDPGILNRTDRDWGKKVWAMVGGGTAANPFHLTTDARFSNFAFGGLITGAPAATNLNDKHFAAEGLLVPFNHGIASGTANFEIGGDGAVHNGSLKAINNTNQLFGRADYDFTETVHGFLETVYNWNHVQNFGGYNQLNALLFNGTNAFFPTALQFNGQFRLSKFMRGTPRITTNSDQKQMLVLGGLNGKIFGDWRWQVNVEHSGARSTTRNSSQINAQKLFAALDATRDTAGNIVCRTTLTNPGLNPGCVPLNPFGPTSESAAAMAYVTEQTGFTVTNGMDDLSASLTGSPFDDWAGPVTVAFSAEYRKQTLKVDSTGQPSDLANCTGLLNCTQGNTQLYRDATLQGLPQVSNSVTEGAFEAQIPLAKDIRFVRDLSLNSAVRYTNYKTSGSLLSWKTGLAWQVTDSFKLRGTRSRDIRAPTLYDLYQPQSVNRNATVTDLLTNVTGISTVYAGGNPNLVPEVAHTTTAGFVWQPGWLPGLSFSADAYNVDISKAIITFNPTLPGQNTCYQSGGTSLICTLIVRPFPITNTTAANTATAWYNTTLNISNFTTYGMDFEANYARQLFNNPFSVRGLVTWQPHVITATPGSAVADNAGGAITSLGGGPAWAAPLVRANLLFNYRVRNLEVGVHERWRSFLLYQAATTNIYAPLTTVPAQAYTDLNFRYHFPMASGSQTDLVLSIQNLFNAQPPPDAGNAQIGNTGLFGGFAPGDDAIGRYFNLGVRWRL